MIRRSTGSMSRTMRSATSVMCLPVSMASARSACSVRANMRCESGSIPDKVAARGLTAGESRISPHGHRIFQVSTGTLNQPTGPQVGAFQVSLQARGRLSTPEEFGEVILRTTSRWRRAAPEGAGPRRAGRQRLFHQCLSLGQGDGRHPDQREAGVELAGGCQYGQGHDGAAGRRSSRKGLRHDIAYNPTEFVETSIEKVYSARSTRRSRS